MAEIGPCRCPRNPKTATLREVKQPSRKNIRTITQKIYRAPVHNTKAVVIVKKVLFCAGWDQSTEEHK